MSWAAVAAAVSAVVTGYSVEQQNRTNRAIAYNNKVMNEYAAQDAERRGEKEAQDVRRKADGLKGTQRAMLAARGLDLGVGTAAEVVDQTDYLSILDQATARDNARKEAWQHRVAGAQGMAAASVQASQNYQQGFSTLLTNGQTVAKRWYNG
jgi:hypothetical protein